MSHYVMVPFSGQAHLQKMIDLVNSRPAGRISDFPSLVDLQEMLGVSEIQAYTSLWEDASGCLAGFAILDDTQLIFEIEPRALQSGLGETVVQWGVDCLRKSQGAPGGGLELEASCRDDDPARRSLFEQAGFQLLPGGALHMARSLNEPLPDIQLPPGFSIRPIAGESEVPSWVAMHRLAWGTENMTVEYRLSMMHTPSYDPGLDLVAVAPDGSLAAYCVCYISYEENALSGRKDGYTDPIATHPAFQRRGLARALILTGLNLLKQRDTDTARLSTSSENIAMQRVAQSVGFLVDHRWLRYSRRIERAG